MGIAEQWDITVRRVEDGRRFTTRRFTGDVDKPASFRAELLAIARTEDPLRTNSGENWIGEYELEVRRPGRVQWQPPDHVLRFRKGDA